MCLKLLKIFGDFKHKLIIRIRGLLLYLHDYKAVGFCLTYIIVQPVIIGILRNISRMQTIGLLIVLFCILVVFVIVDRVVLEKSKKIFERKDAKLLQKKYAQLFVLGYYLIISSIFQIIRCLPIITIENKMEKGELCFTGCFTQIKGFVTEKPTQKYAYQQLEVQVLQANVENEQKILKDKIKIIVKTEKFRDISVGQVCSVSGRMVRPENFSDFNYKDFLKNKGIFFTMDFPDIECEDIDKIRAGNPLVNNLTDARSIMEDRIDNILNEPQSSLLCGILFGSDRLLDKDFEEGIRSAGVSHIISASGYNITIMSLAVSKVFSFLPKKKEIVVTIIVI